MKIADELKKSFFIALWFILLTFPIMVIRVNTIEKVIVWRWLNLLYVGIGSFMLSFLWQLFSKKRNLSVQTIRTTPSHMRRLLDEPKFNRPALVIIAIFTLIFPFVFSHYQVNIMTTALIYVMLGL